MEADVHATIPIADDEQHLVLVVRQLSLREVSGSSVGTDYWEEALGRLVGDPASWSLPTCGCLASVVWS